MYATLCTNLHASSSQHLPPLPSSSTRPFTPLRPLRHPRSPSSTVFHAPPRHSYRKLTSQLQELAGGKIVLALEGGYSLAATSASAAGCMSALLGIVEKPPPDPALRWAASYSPNPSLRFMNSLQASILSQPSASSLSSTSRKCRACFLFYLFVTLNLLTLSHF